MYITTNQYNHYYNHLMSFINNNEISTMVTGPTLTGKTAATFEIMRKLKALELDTICYYLSIKNHIKINKKIFLEEILSSFNHLLLFHGDESVKTERILRKIENDCFILKQNNCILIIDHFESIHPIQVTVLNEIRQLLLVRNINLKIIFISIDFNISNFFKNDILLPNTFYNFQNIISKNDYTDFINIYNEIKQVDIYSKIHSLDLLYNYLTTLNKFNQNGIPPVYLLNILESLKSFPNTRDCDIYTFSNLD